MVLLATPALKPFRIRAIDEREGMGGPFSHHMLPPFLSGEAFGRFDVPGRQQGTISGPGGILSFSFMPFLSPMRAKCRTYAAQAFHFSVLVSNSPFDVFEKRCYWAYSEHMADVQETSWRGHGFQGPSWHDSNEGYGLI